jgi:cbb3-type cytochrome oxidase maturation protein
MSAIYIMAAASIVIAGGFLLAFIWSVKNGQFEDDYTPSVRILFDDVNKSQKKTQEVQDGSNSEIISSSTGKK